MSGVAHHKGDWKLKKPKHVKIDYHKWNRKHINRKIDDSLDAEFPKSKAPHLKYNPHK